MSLVTTSEKVSIGSSSDMSLNPPVGEIRTPTCPLSQTSNTRSNRLSEKAGSVPRRTSVFIGSPIRSCPKKLIDQVSVRRMNLNPIKSRFFRVGGCPPIVIQGLFDPAGRQGNWLRDLCQTRGNQRLTPGTDC